MKQISPLQLNDIVQMIGQHRLATVVEIAMEWGQYWTVFTILPPGFEFKIVFLQDWLLSRVKEFSLSYYFTYT